MGVHICEYCKAESIQPPAHSSGDVTLKFDNGHEYIMPDMIVHYVRDHDYQPPAHFVDDVLNTEFSGGMRVQTFGARSPEKVGYLHGDFPKGDLADVFVPRLKELMEQAAADGFRIQTNG